MEVTILAVFFLVSILLYSVGWVTKNAGMKLLAWGWLIATSFLVLSGSGFQQPALNSTLVIATNGSFVSSNTVVGYSNVKNSWTDNLGLLFLVTGVLFGAMDAMEWFKSMYDKARGRA